MDWQIPLIISAIGFAAFLIFRMRPVVTPSGRASKAALNEAKKRIEAAKDDESKAVALADAADASAKLGRLNGAVGLYQRALRADGRSASIVERAAISLARRPSALEQLLWRHLGAQPWTTENRDAVKASLRALGKVYERRRRHHVRAQAIEHALRALTE